MNPSLPVALQLWSIREEVTRDFSGTMAHVAGLGFTGVELAGLGPTTPTDADRALRAAGLRVVGLHVMMDQLRSNLSQVVEQALELGTPHVICPWYPPRLIRTVAAAEALGQELNELGARLRVHGLRFHYHHHDFDLASVAGRPLLDWILDASEPRHVGCEADVYWLHQGGVAPDRFLLEQGRRVQLVHLKDEKELGTGPVDFLAVFTAIDTVGAAEWLIIEQEQYSVEPLQAVELSLQQLRRWGRA
jgi:sugar phosphate isomerase/epimerase